jgi:hypothetical protein
MLFGGPWLGQDGVVNYNNDEVNDDDEVESTRQ